MRGKRVRSKPHQASLAPPPNSSSPHLHLGFPLPPATLTPLTESKVIQRGVLLIPPRQQRQPLSAVAILIRDVYMDAQLLHACMFSAPDQLLPVSFPLLI